MSVTTASEARKNIFNLIEQVNEDHAPVTITSRRGNAVLMSEADYNAWQEGAYLFRNPANARRLLESYNDALNGDVVRHELIDVDDAEPGDEAA